MARALACVAALTTLAAAAAASMALSEPLRHPNPDNWWAAVQSLTVAETHGRRLQTTCTPSTSNGDWNGQPPNLNAQSFCGYFYWTGSYGNAQTRTLSTTWTLSCLTGYYLSGSSSGTCYGDKTCQYNPSEGTASCTHVCTYQLSSVCQWCCKCTNTYYFSSGGGSCQQCIPPSGSNAKQTPSTTAGVAVYTWDCVPGYYGTSVTRTCGAGNSWTGSAISCTACSAPSAPSNGYSTRSGTELDVWTVGCNNGYVSSTSPAIQTRRCSSTNGAFSGSSPTCSTCGTGSYCVNGVKQLCPGGTFGTSTTAASASCSGSCTAGYFCPAGSTSSTANACGAVDKYCPTGSGAPVTVSANYYTTPDTGSPSLRTGQAACPSERACAGGVVLASIDMTAQCPAGTAEAQVEELLTSTDFGPQFSVTTPGYTGSLTWSVQGVVANDATCNVRSTNFTFSTGTISAGTTWGRLRIGAWPVDYPSCMNGFRLTIRAARSNNAAMFQQCAVDVEVLQVAKPPVITDCGNRAVAERSIAGTNIGSALTAMNRNVGTSLLWFVNYTTSGNVPISVGMCDGQLRVLRPFLWKDARSYRVDLTVRNDGSALGIGSRTATCRMWVNVTMVPLPPNPTVTTFWLPELSPVGTLVGNVAGVDPNNFTFNATWGRTDTPNAFAISRTGNITVAQVHDTLTSGKSTFSYMVNLTNGFAQSSNPVTINMLVVPRPPVVFDQTRSVREDASVGTRMTPALTASHPQGKVFNFSLVCPQQAFEVSWDGFVFVNASGLLDFNVQPVFLCTILVRDSDGRVTQATLNVSLIEVNKSPRFTSPNYTFVVDEGALVGDAVIGSPAVGATDPNVRDALTFTMPTANPASGRTTFAVNPLSGGITLGSGLAATGGVLRFDASLVYPQPQTYVLGLTVSDNGSPRMAVNATVAVTVRNIRPRITFTGASPGTYIIPSNATAGRVVVDMAALTWTAYSRANLLFSAVSESTASGDVAFVIHPGTGVLSVNNLTYVRPSDNRTVFVPPAFDFNTKSTYQVNVTARQLDNALVATVPVTVMLTHVNRPPTWSAVPLMFAAQLTLADIGQPLMNYLVDPDRTVPGIQENFTFAIVSGNVDATFTISSTTGQISVLNRLATAFQFNGGVGTFNLTVNVRDAGINGPVYNASTVVSIRVIDSNQPPSIGFHNLTVNELVPVGTIVGLVEGTDLDNGQTLAYSLAPAGPNVNRPFPFEITTVAGGPRGRGQIRVINDGPIDWNELFKVYYATVTVTDSHSTAPLSGSGPVEIWVNWVPRPPFFNPSRVANSTTFTLSVPERSPPGWNLTSPSTALTGSSKDPWQRPQLRYSWVGMPAALTTVFLVNGTTGAVTLGPGAAGNFLNFNRQPRYTLTLRVRDGMGLTDDATVVIDVQDVNDAAGIQGLWDGANRTQVAALTVVENATVGTVIGHVRATDPDVDRWWGAMNFELLPTLDARFFAINATSGAIRVDAAGMDFWDQTTFLLNVTVTDDDPFQPIVVPYAVRVNLVQVNTVRIGGFAVPAGTPASQAVNVSGSAFGLTHAGIDVLVTSAGFTDLWILGSGFGRTARRLSNEGATAASTVVTATYGPTTGREFAAGPCAVMVANTVIRCTVPVRTGRSFAWSIRVDGWNATSGAYRTGYLPPVITKVVRLGGVDANPATQLLTTRGGEVLRVEGTDFGAVSSDVAFAYGPAAGPLGYGSPSCNVTVAHTEIRCWTVQGIGAGLGFRATVSAQASGVFNATAVAYSPPSITRVSAPVLQTAGGEVDAFVIDGANLGPAGTTGIAVAYGVDFANSYWPVFSAVGCYVVPASAHAQVRCTSAAGIGANLSVAITVGGQSSAAAGGANRVSYRPPAITGIGGAGAVDANTEGGQQIIITGAQFGLLTPLRADGSIIAGALQPRAVYGKGGAGNYTAANCRVAAANTQIVCDTVPGTGRGHLWRVTVGEQTSVLFTNASTSYHPPIVANYGDEGASLALTQGGQRVRIDGSNFGPAGTPIELATYGRGGNGTDFTASNCSLVAAHRTVECYTVVGAGAGLSWFVWIDGQRSVAPSTNYGPPVVATFGGDAGVDIGNLQTDGGQTLLINGAWFSVDRFLESVTYGPSGSEFAAAGCRLSVNHTQLSCRTVPGVGRVLRWLVRVGGQTSVLAGDGIAYAPPSLTTLQRRPGAPGAGIPTNGGTEMQLVGRNFGLAYSGAQVSIKVNNLGLVRPSPVDMDAHWDAVYRGASGDPAVAAWIDSLTTVLPTTRTILPAGAGHQVTFMVPEGFGAAVDVFLVVNGVPSNRLNFSYDAPVIRNVAPDRQNITAENELRVIVEGASFCSGNQGCGVMLVDGQPPARPPVQWSHNSIMVFVIQLDPEVDMNMTLVIGGQVSNAFLFRKLAPNVNSLVTQPTWVNMHTRGGELFRVLGVMDIGVQPLNISIGGRECVYQDRIVDNGRQPNEQGASFTVYCITPAGVGQGLPVLITSFGLTSAALDSLTLSYAPPRIANVTLDVPAGGRRRLQDAAGLPDGIPTLGANVTVRGEFFGTADLGVGTMTMDAASQLQVVHQDHEVLRFAIPPGDGLNHFIEFLVGGQGSPRLAFRYTGPAVTGVAPFNGPTVGGTVISVSGRNFGLTAPTITVGGRPCPLLLPFAPAADHGLVRCRTPAGQNTGLPVIVTVNGQTSPAAATAAGLFSYDVPVVSWVSPTGGPTSGRELGARLDEMNYGVGPRIVQTVAGVNFGLSGSVFLRPFNNPDPLAVAVAVPAGDVLSWNHTHVVFYMPEGFGAGLKVVVAAGSQESTITTPVTFSYDPPVVFNVTHHERTVADCRPRRNCFYFDQGNVTITRCRLVSASCYETRGGYPLRIIGASFGPQGSVASATSVWLGGRRCVRDDANAAAQGHNQLVCVVPQGLGDANAVRVVVGSRSSAVDATTPRFAYDPPEVVGVMPNTPNARGGQAISFRGKNFGFEATPLAITMNDKPCLRPGWTSDAVLTCEPDEDVVGPKNVSILVANRTTPFSFFDVEEMVTSECIYGYYGMRGELCSPCMRGAMCPGGEQLVDLVYSLPGYWRSNLTVPQPSNLCHANTQGRVQHGCPSLYACEPPWSCLGSNACAEGYEGERCMFCLRGKYYRVNGECVKCPDSVWAVIIGLVLLLVAMAGFAYWLNKKNISIALISIGVDYAQVLSMFSKTRIRWPAAVKQIFQILSAFNLNIELTAPECLAPEVQFWQKWALVEALPIFAMFIFLTVHAMKMCYKATCTSKTDKRHLYSHTPTLISTTIVVFRVLYLLLTRTSMDVMNCAPTNPPDPDGKEYMSGNLDIVCWQPGSQQVILFPFALCTLGLYTLALPIAVFLFMRRSKDAIKTDQLLRAKGMGEDRLTNPKYYEFRKSWHKLYYHFKPGRWYWELVICARKALLAFVSLMFRASPSYQLALALLVLFGCYVLHMRALPYLTHSDKPKVIAEHQAKVLTDPSHATIEAEMRAAERKFAKKSSARAAVFDVTKRKFNAGQAILLAAFDYNTVEAVMLASAILVQLAGIVFDSSHFADVNMTADRRLQYDLWAWATVTIISLTLGYYLLTFVLDMSLLLCPQRSAGVFALCQKREGPKARTGAKHAAGGVGLAPSAGGDDGGSGGGEMHVNPFMLKQMAAGKGEGEDGGMFSDVAGIMDPTAVAAMSVPSEGMWKAVQTSYGRLAVMVDSLRAELRDSKKAADAVSAAEGARVAPTRANPLAAKTRRQFGPMMRRGDSDEGEGGAEAAAKAKPRAKPGSDEGDELGMARSRSRSGSNAASGLRLGGRGASGRRLVGSAGDGDADTGMLTNPIGTGGGAGEEGDAGKRAEAVKSSLSGFGARNPLAGRKPGGLVLGSRRAVAKEFMGGGDDE